MSSPPSVPDATGHFGKYGGMFVPETLMAPLQELAEEYERARVDEEFQGAFESLRKGVPSALKSCDCRAD